MRLLFAEAYARKTKQPFCLLIVILYDNVFGVAFGLLSNGFLLLEPWRILSLHGDKHLQLPLSRWILAVR